MTMTRLNRILTRSATAAVLASTMLMAIQPADAAVPPLGFSALYVFGDSLSDNGNLFAQTGIPPAPYFQGRFSNGPVAVEYLAGHLGLNSSQMHNFAVAGAKTSTDGQLPNSGMLNQLASFQSSLGGGTADAGALYFVWGGANDLRAAPAAATVVSAITNLTTIVSGLYTSGARQFLLPDLPDLGLTPEAIAGGPAAVTGATFLSNSFNAALASAYGGLLGALPGAQFNYFSAMNAQRAVVAGVGSNGFDNVTDMCLSAGMVCATPGTYLYWDNIHPTTAAHMLLGSQMAAAVPEPESMLLMAVGLLALLGLQRRRCRAVAVG